MRNLLSWIVLIVAFAAFTILVGWWAVPVVGAAWGLLANRRGAWRAAAASAAIAWAILLASAVFDALGLVMSQLAGSLRLPTLIIAILTLGLPALLAGSAAELAVVARVAIATSRRRSAAEG
jgi:hypothetical protein